MDTHELNNLEIKKEVTLIIKRRLWSNGLSAQDVPNINDGYDLVVNNTIKVAISYANFARDKNGIYWLLPDFPLKTKVDILAIVIGTPLEDTLTYYTKISKNKINSLIEDGLLVGDVLKIDPKQLKNIFTDSPKIFIN